MYDKPVHDTRPVPSSLLPPLSIMPSRQISSSLTANMLLDLHSMLPYHFLWHLRPLQQTLHLHPPPYPSHHLLIGAGSLSQRHHFWHGMGHFCTHLSLLQRRIRNRGACVVPTYNTASFPWSNISTGILLSPHRQVYHLCHALRQKLPAKPISSVLDLPRPGRAPAPRSLSVIRMTLYFLCRCAECELS